MIWTAISTKPCPHSCILLTTFVIIVNTKCSKWYQKKTEWVEMRNFRLTYKLILETVIGDFEDSFTNRPSYNSSAYCLYRSPIWYLQYVIGRYSKRIWKTVNLSASIYFLILDDDKEELVTQISFRYNNNLYAGSYELCAWLFYLDRGLYALSIPLAKCNVRCGEHPGSKNTRSTNT